jgi:putative ABC transport system permease protein
VSGLRTSLRPVLRIARRDVRRAPGRSLLVVLMVALPVSGAAFLDVVLRTTDVRGTEKIALQLGRTADARVSPQGSGSPVLQRPDDEHGIPPTSPAAAPVEQLPPTDPRPLLPAGTRVITDRAGELAVRTTDGLARAGFRELDVDDPMAEGLFTLVDGRAPQDTGEVAVSPALLETLGTSVGDDLEIASSVERSLRIVGTVRPTTEAQGTDVAVALPGTLLDEVQDSPGIGWVAPASLLVDTPTPVTWDQVLELNEVGVAVFSRAVVEDPPLRSEVPLYADPGYREQGVDGAVIIAVVLVVGLSVAEVALLAGAAFAVGMRRQSRALGLLAASGAQSRQVRAVVLGQGLVLGGVGGLVGVAAGTLAGVAAVQIATTRFDRFLLSPDVRPLELLALTLLGIGTGLLAAVLPARSAARQDVVAALSGRRGVVRTRRRYPVVGLVTAVVGAVLALGGGAAALGLQRSGEGGSRALGLVAGMVLVGAVLTQVGLVVATPALVGGAARLGRFLPLAPRLALRDAARHRGRTAPAVAAVLAAVSGSVALTLFVAAMSDKDERAYTPAMAYGQAFLRAGDAPGQPRAEALLEAVRRVAPPDRELPVTSFPSSSCTTSCTSVAVVAPPEQRCPLEALTAGGREVTAAQADAAMDDPRCNRAGYAYSSPFSGPVVGSYDELVRLTGLTSPAARRALEDGGMVVFDRAQVAAGRGAVEVVTYDSTSGRTDPPRTVRLPATYVDPGGPGVVSGWLSPAAAAQVGVPTGLEGVVVEYDVPPDDDTEEAVSAALVELGDAGFFRVERGYRDAYGVGLLALLVGSAVVTLGASAVATGLAQADGRADQATLAAVGAAPRLRRRLTAFQAATVAGLGAALGTVAGFVPTSAYLYADEEMRFVPPWLHLAVIALVVPGVAALLAGLVTRSRLPMARRLPS